MCNDCKMRGIYEKVPELFCRFKWSLTIDVSEEGAICVNLVIGR